MGRRTAAQSKISKLRQDANLTQSELAELLGVSRGTIKNWEAGTMQDTLLMIVKMCRIFRCSLLDLLD